jgi:hypothetical protein
LRYSVGHTSFPDAIGVETCQTQSGEVYGDVGAELSHQSISPEYISAVYEGLGHLGGYNLGGFLRIRYSQFDVRERGNQESCSLGANAGYSG